VRRAGVPRPDWRGAPRRPPALRAGDVIAVVAPASAARAARIRRGVRTLERLGFRVRVHRQAFARHGHFAGPDGRRAAALRQGLADSRARAVVFTRGGFGAARLLPLVERALARSRPKVVVGYSDATSLLTFLTGKLGWVTFHGPMVASDFPDLAAGDGRAFVDVLRGAPPQPLRVATMLRAGSAEGRLIGGCLSILVSLLGTPYAVSLAGSIAFIEDVNEEPYSIDRMLTQLRQAGAFARTRAIVFGEMKNCGSRRELLAVLRDRTADLGIPIAFGLPSGHGRGKRTLPFGARARLDGRRRVLEITSRAVTT